MAAPMADRRLPFFKRSLFYYVGPQLDGEYWLGPVRFAPVWPDDDEPHAINVERAVSIDQVVLGIDQMDAWALARESSVRLAARLSLLLDQGLSDPSHDKLWVWPVKDAAPAERSLRAQHGIYGYGPELTEMPKKGAVCRPGGLQGLTSGPVPDFRGAIKLAARSSPHPTRNRFRCPEHSRMLR
jgi:hypothetical protein